MVYYLTFTTYGTPTEAPAKRPTGLRMLVANRTWHEAAPQKIIGDPYTLSTQAQDVALQAILEKCKSRGWQPLAVHVLANHVHLVLDCDEPGESVMTKVKAYASRALIAAEGKHAHHWTPHGTVRELHQQDQINELVQYVAYGQGEPTAMWVEGGLG